MLHPEASLLPLSALQHLLFCERQCALIHLEREWVENRFTAEGRVLHRKAHDGDDETRDGVRTTRGLPVRSFKLGIAGQCDVVTFEPPAGFTRQLAGRQFAAFLTEASPNELRDWAVTPVEYKRGKPKSNDCDRVQLCAQAICLEEMLGVTIPAGDLFYGQKRRRVSVEFTQTLRAVTERAAARLHEMFDAGVTPPAVREKKCDTCSLLPVCLPDAMTRRSARGFVDRQWSTVFSDDFVPAEDDE